MEFSNIEGGLRRHTARRAGVPAYAAQRQRTLKNTIHCCGVGLHSGARVSLRHVPADPDSGITFHRTDAAGRGAMIPADWRHVRDTRLCSTIGTDDGITIGTVEHLMAALAGSGIDNLVIEVDGPEVPIMDGSSAPFVFLIECAGVVEQQAPRKAIRILKPVSVGDDTRRATLTPADGFSLSFEIDFESAAIQRQSLSVEMADGTFKDDLARARTFGFLHEIDYLRANGLARGGSLENAVVISGDKIMNEGGLRFDDEFVRHKMLDSVGDLYLAGAPIVGHFHGRRSGHALNHQLLVALFADRTAWCEDTLAADLGGAAWLMRGAAANS
jgi:UDP-3-O-[3-hydroxymyristoyl] N-acetylglucosamine deacetylase